MNSSGSLLTILPSPLAHVALMNDRPGAGPPEDKAGTKRRAPLCQLRPVAHTEPGNPRKGREARRVVNGLATRLSALCEATQERSRRTA